MAYQTKICVFSLSDRDIFKTNDMHFAVDWLKNKRENWYYFRSTKPKSLVKGSTVLFSFNTRLFGQATVKQEPIEVPLEEQQEIEQNQGYLYKYKMKFEAPSIQVYQYYPSKKDIKGKLGIQFAQLFTYLSEQQYQEILKMTKV